MPLNEISELDEVDTVLDGLSSPTSLEVYEAMLPYDHRLVEAAAAQRALSGGGGGGSLPSWWTVDSTPGSASVEFAGAVTISPSESDPSSPALGVQVNSKDDTRGFEVYSRDGNGSITWSPQLGLYVEAEDDSTALVEIKGTAHSDVFVIAPTGAVTISPSGGAAPLTLVGLPTADPTVAGQFWNDTGTVKVSAG